MIRSLPSVKGRYDHSFRTLRVPLLLLSGVVENAKNRQAKPQSCKAAYLTTGETVYMRLTDNRMG